MFDVPNSGAMDATACRGGPSTVLAEIVTGSPELITRHSDELRAKAAEFVALLDEFGRASDRLTAVWAGPDSAGTVRKIAESRTAVAELVLGIEAEANRLGAAATLVRDAQAAYRGVVDLVNPAVAALLSNHWTYPAAVALSTSASAALRAFIAETLHTLRGQWHG